MRKLLLVYKTPRAIDYVEELDHSVLSDEEEKDAKWLEGCHIASVEAHFEEEGEGWVTLSMNNAHFTTYDPKTQMIYLKVADTAEGFPRAWCHFSLPQLNSFIAREKDIDQVCPPSGALSGATARYFCLDKGTGNIEHQYEGPLTDAHFSAYSSEKKMVSIHLAQEENDEDEEDLFQVIIVLPLAQIEWFVNTATARMAK